MSLRLSNRPIRQQVLAGLLVAVLALVGISAVTVYERWRTLADLGRVETLTEAAVAIGSLAHELQKERGASALFLASGGTQFRSELTEQRRLTSQAAAALTHALAPLRDQPAYAAFLTRLAEAEGLLAGQDARRAGIDRLTVKGPDSFAQYTRLISGLLDATGELARASTDAEVRQLVHAYAALLQGKERAGQERATGSAGFAAGRFDGTLYARLIGLIAAQDAYFGVHRASAPAELGAALTRELEGADSQGVEGLRRLAIDAGIGGDLKGTPAPHWFKATTARIDRLKAVEDATANALRATAAAAAKRAATDFAILLGVALVASAGAVAIGLMVVGSVTRAIGGLTGATTRIAEGDVQVTVPGEERGDELGHLARAIHAIRNAGVAAMRVKTALDTVSANVMMADRDGTLIYVNRAVQEMFKTAEEDIRRQLPGFDASSLIGADFDRFHKNPAEQRAMIRDLTAPHRARIEVGSRRFDLVATPVIDAAGERHGTVVEWRDVTQELTIQAEIAAMSEAAAAGDFTRRIDPAGKSGFMLDLARRLNAQSEAAARSLRDVVDFLEALADGDLGRRMTGEHEGMFARIRDDANRTADRLSDIVSGIAAAAETIASAAAEISAGSDDLAHRTEQQAASLEQTAAAMEELGATVRENADSAHEANQLAAQARKAAESGGSVAGSAVTAMQRIEESARRITDIIGVIDEIAFQTNLLALNAAVEAARAGDAGRGFAVVAQEVRQLAQRSAQASKEIKALILDSDGQVRDGVALVRQAGSALDGIMAGVQDVATRIAGMATASAEQAGALDEINATVSQMDEMTQKNAAMVEETSGAARSLADQAGDLRRMIAFFRNAAGG
ncbi:HAMP domain-containing protein [Azospirillum sp. RWY-5-1]|uniref:HAMP domain-containing protein n=1 Tax=Azospirillum oleiclasticum TaxID=2735135 RepID=A0ABX2TBM1_9PROT|nr:methyl-accepting chemotaxis protein [Azospirillum oleiclasticum]NYZ14102.1 HAMP domain-containing protein [Azospirillum oleiclasticum]NYZ21586.1 HAMP domain-containing protein [Azospirillum oleiclasticum]